MYIEDYYVSDEEVDNSSENWIIYTEDIYQFKIRQIENFKSLIYHEPEFIGIYNISSQEILNIIENSINNDYNYFYYKYKPTKDQIILFSKIYNIILKTNNVNLEHIYSIINCIYNKLYI